MPNESSGLPEFVHMRDVQVDPRMYTHYSLGDPQLDHFISNRGGLPASTITMVTGEAGSGKTTLMCKWIASAQQQGAQVLYISSEMDQIDFAEYVERFPEFGDLPVFFVDFERNISKDLTNVMKVGWDIVLIDSFKDLQDKIADQRGLTKTAAELFLTNLMKTAKAGTVRVDGETVYTSFLVIQQVLKSGRFAGSNTLAHLITAHCALVKEDGETFLTYLKNRRGKADLHMYYVIKTNEIHYDLDRRGIEDIAVDFIEQEQDRQREDKRKFASLDELLSKTDKKIREEEAEKEKNVKRININDLIDSPEDDEDEFELPSSRGNDIFADVDMETLSEIFEEQNGKTAAVRRELISRGLVDESVRWDQVAKFLEASGFERNRYNT